MMGLTACFANRVEFEPVEIRTTREAENAIPKFDGKELRGIMLDE